MREQLKLMDLNTSPLLLRRALTLLIMQKTLTTMIASLTMDILSIVAIMMMPISDQIKCAAAVKRFVKTRLTI